MALTTTTNSSSQTTTGTPQTAIGSSGPSTTTGSVQSGTADALLNSHSGIALQPSSLSTISLSPSTTSATTSTAVLPAKHHVKVALFGITAALVVVAITMFWLARRSVKTTT